jgi:hypothetical protein
MKSAVLFLIPVFGASISFGQNIGIGTDAPAFKLDVNGRIRIRHTNSTAGIFFDGPVNTQVGFIGTFDNNTIGMYGSVSGWSLLLNTQTGNVGIGTTAPTSDLDLNGLLRLRGGAPTNGAVLVSKDASGNTNWQRVYAFRTEGLFGNSDIIFSANQTSQLSFNNILAYNEGLVYLPNSSQFSVPVKGIYNFTVNVETYPNVSGKAGAVNLRLMRTRNGVSTILAKHYNSVYITDVNNYMPEMTRTITGDFKLEAGDIIWVQLNTAQSTIVYGAPESTNFCGRLVTQFF